ncbi:hypothetical protein IFM89_022320 [Coptis chinensis]|uniref:Pentatricopeptide repeat-containing protein n=1 Tax=Coptis chinensis TaxID=261450 RepID=A0A835I4F1_9MAGN|nr:hypothetical protein IFM89_022320 [Coptis chinensis]
MNKLITAKKDTVLRKLSTFGEQTKIPSKLRTLLSSLQACAHQKNVLKGKEIHATILLNDFMDYPFSVTALINLYSKCNRPDDAFAIFKNAPERNLFIWNAIIAGSVGNGLSRDGFELYQEMRRHDNVVPDKYTYPCVIKACCDLGKVGEVRGIHGEVLKSGFDNDSFIVSSLINFYLKFSCMVEAQHLFEQLSKGEKDVVLWNSLINGYAQIRQFTEALDVFGKMMEEGVTPTKFTLTGILSVFTMTKDLKNGRIIHGYVKRTGYESDISVSNALIDMYGKCKSVAAADNFFENMSERDLFSWNSIISVHEQSADYNGTLMLFHRMQGAGVQPDIVTITTVLPACSHLSAFMRGREIHGYMIVNGMTKDCYIKDVKCVHVENAVMDMYAKCGSLEDAQLVFDKMRNRDVASWNIMTMGYGMHGYADKALDMFSRMCEKGVRPDEVTFVTILSACSHAGLVESGRNFLAKMELDYGVIPTIEHYACVVDMLGRAGHLNEAYQLALTIPVETNAVLWRAFLAACRLHRNAPLANIAAQKVFELEPDHCGSYVLISNVYGSTGRYEDVSEMRQTMRNTNIHKTPGCSWVELKSGVHRFGMEDRTHPASNHLYSELDALTGNLFAYGYTPDVENICAM